MTSATAASEALVAAVTEPTRRRMLDLLLEKGEATATSLADSLPITRQAVSKHLSVLHRVGIVTSRKTGRELLYRVNTERLDRAARSLSDLASSWDRRLERIKRLAEAAKAAGGEG
jgi:DNA-binding transcriptional ArsR family regulator